MAGAVQWPVPSWLRQFATLGELDGRLDLAGGTWRLQRVSLVSGDGQDVSKLGLSRCGLGSRDRAWTVLTSYLNVQAIPDPNFGKNQLYVSDSFFYSDFWYRTEFTAPALAAGKIAWLNFDGINWKADVFLNGEEIGRIEGGFMRGRFDVTSKLRPGEERTRGANREERHPRQLQAEDL